MRERKSRFRLSVVGLGRSFRRPSALALQFQTRLQFFPLQRQSSQYRLTQHTSQQWLPRRSSVPLRRTSPSAPMSAKVSKCDDLLRYVYTRTDIFPLQASSFSVSPASSPLSTTPSSTSPISRTFKASAYNIPHPESRRNAESGQRGC